MERRWLVPLVIGGGAVLLVAIFVLFGGGSKTPPTLDAAPLDDASTPIDTTAPAWMNATYAPTNAMPTLTATQATTTPPIATPPTNPLLGDAVVVPQPPIDLEAAANAPSSGTPLINGTQQQVVAVLKEHIAGLEEDIAKKEAAGKHEEAERERKSLERLKGQLDMVLDGGPP